MGKKDKTVKFGADPKADKTPKLTPFADTPIRFAWSFSIMDNDGPFGWSHCDCPRKFLEVLNKKGQLEQLSWSDLGQAGCHPVAVHKLEKPAQKRLQEIKQDDNDHLYSVRLTGKNRVWCVQHSHVLRVLWWDPDHLVCPSHLKNT